MKRLNILIPSRTQPTQSAFLRAALASIRSQKGADNLELQVIVGIDAGGLSAELRSEFPEVCFVESSAKSQAAALNAAIALVDADYVAFLEDDDQWQPDYLQLMLRLADEVPFVSSTQSEYDETGAFLRVNDFPTPSGWFMRATTLSAVGGFSTEFKYHLDNDWLGRLNQKIANRLHLVEATAPIHLGLAQQVRPWLANVVKNSSGKCQLARHGSPYQLIRRLVHSGSGMYKIARDPALRAESKKEQEKLLALYGCLPY